MNVNQLINEINNIEDIEVPYKEDENTKRNSYVFLRIYTNR